MSTKDPTLKKDIERRAETMGVFGIDASGAKHKYCAMTGLLVVETPDGDIEYSKAVTPDRIDDPRNGWIRFVGERRGWIDQWFTDDDVGLWEAQDRRRAALETFRAPEER